MLVLTLNTKEIIEISDGKTTIKLGYKVNKNSKNTHRMAFEAPPQFTILRHKKKNDTTLEVVKNSCRTLACKGEVGTFNYCAACRRERARRKTPLYKGDSYDNV